MKSTFDIAGLSLGLSTPFSYEQLAQFAPFRQSVRDPVTVNVTFYPVTEPVVWEEEPTAGDFYLPRVLSFNGHRYIGYRINNRRCHAWMETDGETVSCYYMEDSLKYFPTERQVFSVICLEHLLNLHHGFILHSSFIRWQGMGIVFTAPSGTGKSTQADLWEKYETAEILNGDRTALRCVNEVWRAYGLPYAGSSAIYRNESAPLRAIVVLRQAPENRLQRLNEGSQAFRAVYRELTLHPWDEIFMSRTMADLDDLLGKVPVYQLLCRPDQEAVEMLKQEIQRNLPETDGSM